MPGRRSGLTREQIVAAAAELAMAGGVDALTMRELARTLGVGTMSVYHYLPDKDAVLDAVTELVWRKVELPPTGPAHRWRPRIEALARSWRQVMLDHHRLLPLLLTRRYTGPEGLAPVEAMMSALRDAGYDAADGVRCFRLVTGFVVGFVEGEYARSLRDPAAVAATIAAGMDDGRHPRLMEAIRAAADISPDDEFDFGLQLVLDGVEARRPWPLRPGPD